MQACLCVFDLQLFAQEDCQCAGFVFHFALGEVGRLNKVHELYLCAITQDDHYLPLAEDGWNPVHLDLVNLCQRNLSFKFAILDNGQQSRFQIKLCKAAALVQSNHVPLVWASYKGADNTIKHHERALRVWLDLFSLAEEAQILLGDRVPIHYVLADEGRDSHDQKSDAKRWLGNGPKQRLRSAGSLVVLNHLFIAIHSPEGAPLEWLKQLYACILFTSRPTCSQRSSAAAADSASCRNKKSLWKGRAAPKCSCKADREAEGTSASFWLRHGRAKLLEPTNLT
mmetsp:Transcript_36080/g.82861  ORF Transcript_36080/g.82861 Transcript_36080/m.82861 type:complete len:283 (-) Transcript_36080:8-856(-)